MHYETNSRNLRTGSLYNTRKFCCIKQGNDETWDSSKVIVEGEQVTRYKPTTIVERELHVDECPIGLVATLSRRGSLEIKFGKLCSTLIEASQTLINSLKAFAGDFGCKKFHL